MKRQIKRDETGKFARKRERTDKGRFVKGNTEAAGGENKKGRNGRPPKFAKQALYDFLFNPAAPEDPDSASLVETARQTILDAMRDRDEDGNVTPAAITAARDVWDRAFGRARQSVDLRVSNTEKLLGDLDNAEQAIDEEIGGLHERHRLNGHANGKL